MAKIYLPFLEWPQQDQEAWDKAIEDGDILDGRGPAFHWAAATRRTNINHYGRWLAFLAATGRMDAAYCPAGRVKPDVVRAYVEQMKARIAPRTVVSSLVGLKVMLKVMVPDHEWRWLADICNRLNRNAKPSKDKRSKMLSSITIYDTAIKRLEDLARTDLIKRVQIVGFRNCLMVALMTACPLRLKNFTSLTIGINFLKLSNGWLIKIPGKEVKNGQPMSFDVPKPLLPYFEQYLSSVRSQLTKADEGPLWVAWDGTRLEYHSIYIAFTRTTKRLFGKSINPHLLRDCAATTLASVSYASALAARGLLGHKHYQTTQKYYIHAKQLEASRKVNNILLGIACRQADTKS
jgi:site-specific recombinase XerC